jgi:Cdc6-like AAA superfamily ATPase
MNRSSSDISLLPGSPKIFHGREAQLQQIVSSLLQPDGPARVAILGPGGVGKSALSLAVLYHPEIVAKFGSERHFISCETSHSAADVAAALSSHFVLEGQGNLMQVVLDYLSGLQRPIVVVLDKMETPWEGRDGRLVVENFLSHLSSIDKLHLIVRSFSFLSL